MKGKKGNSWITAVCLSIIMFAQIFISVQGSFALEQTNNPPADFSFAGFKINTVIPKQDAPLAQEKQTSQVQKVSNKKRITVRRPVTRITSSTQRNHRKNTYKPVIVAKKPQTVNRPVLRKPIKQAVVKVVQKPKAVEPTYKFNSTVAKIASIDNNRQQQNPKLAATAVKVTQKQVVEHKQLATDKKPEANVQKTLSQEPVSNSLQDNKPLTGKAASTDVTIPNKASSAETESVLNLPDYPRHKSYSQKTVPSEPVKEPGYGSIISSLFLVITLILIVGWVYSKLRGINPAAILAGKFNEKGINTFNLLSTTTLGQGKNIHLVEINGKQLVIGSTTNSINLLTEMKPDDAQTKTEIKEDEKENEYIFTDPENYAAGYSEVYKEYLNEKKDDD